MPEGLERFSRVNYFEDKEEVTLADYLSVYGSRIVQDSEKLFINEFLYPLLGGKGIKYVIPQYPFLDSAGRLRKIDFVLIKDTIRIALEVNGETYHAEGVIPNETFDDNLQRQNEILNAGWFLQRFSYNQLQDDLSRKRVIDSLHQVFLRLVPELLSEDLIKPNYLQTAALEALDFYRSKGWDKGVVILPTGTGKTFLAAFDAKKFDGRILFIVHRLDILSQSREAFERIWPSVTFGYLTGEVKEHVRDSKVLFASKDSLRSPDILSKLPRDTFDYIIVDEVHHGQAPTYQSILKHFRAKFMLGLTATPDRTDRKDIFELFDYNKVFEYTLSEAIENGFLVPYTYYGLKDNIDYSRIRHNGQKYNVQDLDRYLIIHQRNKQILYEYIEKGKGGKGIGFCCSINHADKMAAFFNSVGIPAVSITADTEEREKKIKDFRESKYAVAFTVDLFNEGIDFPDVQVLMFLRPTESKKIFIQQLGRGLRLCGGKNRVIVLDFIGNYKKANQIRKYLAKKSQEQKNTASGRILKTIYEYAPNCEVHFDAEVEEIFDNQDRDERGIAREDLIDAYYTLAEKLERKPSQEDINREGEFKVSRYVSVFGSWLAFLRAVNEYTEASYHYPQGLHLGHLLYILKILALNKRSRSHLDDRYVRLRGNLDAGRLGTFQRQTKYKLQGLMEMNIIDDDRKYGAQEEYALELTPEGKKLFEVLQSLIDSLDLSFRKVGDDIPSWNMNLETQQFNRALWGFIKRDMRKRQYVQKLFLKTHAVAQMLNYLYRIERKSIISKSAIYAGFFSAPFVKLYCDQNGIDGATEEGARHRCPFLLNVLEAIGVLDQTRSEVSVNKFLVCKQTMQMSEKESRGSILCRINSLSEYLAGKLKVLPPDDELQLKEAFGKDFLTKDYYLNEYEIIDSEGESSG
jgi:superfamily II DNA or RNA helicase